MVYRIGENHPRWKGNKVKNCALHLWVRKHKPKSKFCEKCNKKKKLQLANISPNYKNRKTYTRDFNNWLWLCQSCHIKQDKRYIPHKKINCTICKKLIKKNSHRQKYCKLCSKMRKKDCWEKWAKNNPKKIKENRKIYYKKNKR